jgi:hypothetical protein
MHTYRAHITWDRQGAMFAGGRYSRGHEWSFDGGVTVPASASPSHVPARTPSSKPSTRRRRWWPPRRAVTC